MVESYPTYPNDVSAPSPYNHRTARRGAYKTSEEEAQGRYRNLRLSFQSMCRQDLEYHKLQLYP